MRRAPRLIGRGGKDWGHGNGFALYFKVLGRAGRVYPALGDILSAPMHAADVRERQRQAVA